MVHDRAVRCCARVQEAVCWAIPAEAVCLCAGYSCSAQADNDNAYAKTRAGRANVMSFAADPAIFPCQLSDATMLAARSAVKSAAAAWGERSLALLDAEDRLSVACEKGATEDQVLMRLRAVYQVMI